MKLLNDVSEALQRYFVTRDLEWLRSASIMIDAEIVNPSLQEATLVLKGLTQQHVQKAVNQHGYMHLSTQNVEDTDEMIEVDKYIRIIDPEVEEAVTVLKVAVIQPDQILLVPYQAGT